MATTEKIRLYKLRGFSQKLNATIEFIRQNIQPLGKSILLILAPLAILNGVLFAEYMNLIFGSINPEDVQQVQNPLVILFNPSYIVFFTISVLASLLNLAIVFNFMAIYDKKFPEPITVTEVFNASIKDIIPLFLFSLLLMIMITAGFIFLVIPGIYLMVVLSVAMPAFFFERKGIMNAIQRAFELIKGKWWSTFGLVIVSTIMMQAVAALFTVPFYIFYFLQIFSLIPEASFEVATEAWWYKGGMIVSIILMLIGTYITYAIPLIALCFQYFNLVERQESKGLLTDIEKLNTEG